MNLFGLVIAFFYVFIISKIYEWTCNATKKEKYIYSLYVFLLQLILEEIMYLLALDGYGLSKFLFPLLIFGYFVGFQKYDKSKGVFISLLFSLLYHSSNNFISVTLSSITGDDIALEYNNHFIIFVLILTYLVIKIVISYFHLEFKYFDKEYLYSFLKKVLYVFIFLHIVSFISDIVSTISHLNSFGSILSSVVFVGLLLTFFAMNSYKVQIEKEIALKQKKFEQKHLQTYTDEIVELYNEIRGFRHDYAGMLVSMQMAIDSGDLQEINRVHNEVLVKANQKLRSDKYTYFDLNNIEDSALRSLIAQSIVYARNNDVEFTLEVKDIITRLSIDLLDLVRIMSILLNNAVEGAADSYLKQMEVAVIKMDFETVIVIQNSCKITMTPSEDLFALGFSTKGRNRGLGLNNVKEILDKYDNIILETEMEDNTFRQIIRFKREFE